jgi:hypothetical protein
MVVILGSPNSSATLRSSKSLALNAFCFSTSTPAATPASSGVVSVVSVSVVSVSVVSVSSSSLSASVKISVMCYLILSRIEGLVSSILPSTNDTPANFCIRENCSFNIAMVYYFKYVNL